VCNGAYLLADAGLLDGLEATTHHGALEELAAAHPKTRVTTNRRFVDCGKVLTCAGVSAGIDGALHVVERLHGDAAARATARYMEYDWRPEEIAKLHAQPGRRVNEGLAFELAELAHRSGVEAALARYRAADPRPDEPSLNRAGYFLMRQEKQREARALFELVVAAFPSSPNALDSLSEACEALDDAPAAIRHAEAALACLEKTPEIEAELARSIRNLCRSRMARLGRGDAQALVFGCPPCGGRCDGVRYLEAGPCPACGMPLERRGAQD
jgi:tetratricopeptide (TPR) repeat protein